MAKQTIGSFLQSLRKASGLTQQEVAEKLGISNKTLSSWETDRAYPDILCIPELADLYGVTADEILSGERTSTTERKNDDENTNGGSEALESKHIKFNTQSYALLIPSCAAAVLMFSSMFCTFNFGIVLLVSGIIALIAAAVLQTVFYKNARICARSAEAESEAREQFSQNIKNTLSRCLLIDGIVYLICGVIIFITAVSRDNGGFAAAALNYMTAAIMAALGFTALIFAWNNADKKPTRIYTEEQKNAADYNERLLAKCLTTAVIPCVLTAAAAALFLFNVFYNTTTLYSGSAKQVKTYLQTLIIENDSELHKTYGADSAGYYFELPSADAVQPFDSFDLEHNFYAYYNPSSDAFVIFYSDESTGNNILSSYAERIMIGGDTAYNVRHCATKETDSSLYNYSGYIYYYYPEYNVELTDELNGVYSVNCKSALYIDDCLICCIWAGLSAAAIALSAVIYIARHKKID